MKYAKWFLSAALFSGAVGVGSAGALGSVTYTGNSCKANAVSYNASSPTQGVAYTQRNGLTGCPVLAARWKNSNLDLVGTWVYAYQSAGGTIATSIRSAGVITGGSHKVQANNGVWYGLET